MYCPFQRDGFMNFSNNYGDDPNYVGSSLRPTRFYQEVKGTGPKALSLLTNHEKRVEEISNFTSHVTDEDFVQPAALWEVIKKELGHEKRFYGNVAVHLSQVKGDRLRNEVYEYLSRINPGLGAGVKKATQELVAS